METFNLKYSIVSPLMHATLEASDNGIIVVDLDGNVIYRNTRLLEMWRIPDELKSCSDGKRLLSFMLDQLSYPDEFLHGVKELHKNPLLSIQEVISFNDGRHFRRTSKPEILDGSVVGRVSSFLGIS